MSRSQLMKYLGAGAAAVVLAFGAYAIGSSGSNSTSGNASAAQSGQAPPGAGVNSAGRPAGRPGGPGGGTAVVGTAATKAGDAATAKYPGTVEGVIGLSDGSYVVHVLSSSGEVHVLVSKTFAVTGFARGRPPGGGGRPGGGGMPGGAPPSGGTPPQGTPPSSGSGGTTS